MEFQVTRSDLFSDDESWSSLLPKGSFVPLSFHQFNADVVYMRCVERSCTVTFNLGTNGWMSLVKLMERGGECLAKQGVPDAQIFFKAKRSKLKHQMGKKV